MGRGTRERLVKCALPGGCRKTQYPKPKSVEECIRPSCDNKQCVDSSLFCSQEEYCYNAKYREICCQTCKNWNAQMYQRAMDDTPFSEPFTEGTLQVLPTVNIDDYEFDDDEDLDVIPSFDAFTQD